MRDLERQIGAKLFEKGRRARLTPLAQTLLPIFNELLATHDRVLIDARHLAQAERGSISLAVVPVLAEEWLPTFLTEFVARLSGRSGSTRPTSARPRCARMVADGTVDIGVAGLLADDPKLDVPAGRERRLRHPVRRRPSARQAPARAAMERVARRAADRQRFLRVAQRTRARRMDRRSGDGGHQPGGLMACVKAGLGVTLVPLLTRAEKAMGFVFVPLDSARASRARSASSRERGQTLLPSVAQCRRLMLALAARPTRAAKAPRWSIATRHAGARKAARATAPEHLHRALTTTFGPPDDARRIV